AGVNQAVIPRDLAYRANKTGDFGIRPACRKIIPADISGLGNDQNMHRRLRRDVMKGQRIVVFIDAVTRDFAAQDTRKNILIVVGIARVNWHYCVLDAFSSRPETPSRRSNSASTSASGILR